MAGRPMQAMTETQSPTTIASFQLSGARDQPPGAREVNTGGDVCTPDEVIGTFLLEASQKRRASCRSRAPAQALTGYLIRPASFSRFSWNLATLSNVVLASCFPVIARSYWSCCWVEVQELRTCHMSLPIEALGPGPVPRTERVILRIRINRLHCRLAPLRGVFHLHIFRQPPLHEANSFLVDEVRVPSGEDKRLSTDLTPTNKFTVSTACSGRLAEYQFVRHL